MSSLNLPDPGTNLHYWAYILKVAKEEKFDGCTFSLEIYQIACFEHDYHYKYHKTVYGTPVEQDQADERFRYVMQCLSPFKLGSPMSWWRWAALRVGGGFAWRTKTKWIG